MILQPNLPVFDHLNYHGCVTIERSVVDPHRKNRAQSQVRVTAESYHFSRLKTGLMKNVSQSSLSYFATGLNRLKIRNYDMTHHASSPREHGDETSPYPLSKESIQALKISNLIVIDPNGVSCIFEFSQGNALFE
jgi:hypothetical protein